MKIAYLLEENGEYPMTAMRMKPTKSDENREQNCSTAGWDISCHDLVTKKVVKEQSGPADEARSGSLCNAATCLSIGYEQAEEV